MSPSPIKSAVEEVDNLGRLFSATLKLYSSSIQVRLDKLRQEIAAKDVNGKKAEIPTHLVRDARDIVTLIRTLKIEPKKGRRRDLKKIEEVVEDLQKIVSEW